MGNFNFTVQDLMDGATGTDSTTNPFTRESTKDLPVGSALITSNSFAQTGTFAPMASASMLSTGEMMMGAPIINNVVNTTNNLNQTVGSVLQGTVNNGNPNSNGNSNASPYFTQVYSLLGIDPSQTGANSGSGASTTSGTTPANASNPDKVRAVLSLAASFIGTVQYTENSNSIIPQNGFDCSGLVHYCFLTTLNIQLPRQAQDQYNAGPALGPNDPFMPGDLIFFSAPPPRNQGSGSGPIGHVGIYSASGQMINAQNPQAGICYSTIPTSIGGSWGAQVIAGATRPIPAALSS